MATTRVNRPMTGNDIRNHSGMPPQIFTPAIAMKKLECSVTDSLPVFFALNPRAQNGHNHQERLSACAKYQSRLTTNLRVFSTSI